MLNDLNNRCFDQKLEEELGDAGEDAVLNKLLDQLENSSEFGGVMENVMKQLLSKEVIQEPLEKLKEQVSYNSYHYAWFVHQHSHTFPPFIAVSWMVRNKQRTDRKSRI